MMISYARDPFHSSTEEYKTIIILNPDVNDFPIENWSLYLPYRKHTFDIEKLENGMPKKLSVSEEVIAFLGNWLGSYSKKFVGKRLVETDLDELIKVVRALRNTTSTLNIQNFILLNTDILNDLKIIFEVINLDLPCDCLKFILQFLNNVTLSNVEAANIVHMKLMQYIDLCFKRNIHIYESSALLYNISLMITISDENIIHNVLNTLRKHTYNEFLYFFLEKQLSLPYIWNIYVSLLTEEKLILLEFIKHLQLQNGSLDLHDDVLNMFIKIFLNSANIIFQTKVVESNKIQEVSLLLEILSAMSSDTNYLLKLTSNKDLLINVGVLLINIHRLGKEPGNCFKPLQHLAEFGSDDGANNHPAFGFKADLIRLIGNMCWKNTEMQILCSADEVIQKGTQTVSPDGRIVVIPPIEGPTTRSRNKKKEKTKPVVKFSLKNQLTNKMNMKTQFLEKHRKLGKSETQCAEKVVKEWHEQIEEKLASSQLFHEMEFGKACNGVYSVNVQKTTYLEADCVQRGV